MSREGEQDVTRFRIPYSDSAILRAGCYLVIMQRPFDAINRSVMTFQYHLRSCEIDPGSYKIIIGK